MKQVAWVNKSQFLSLVYHDIFDYPLRTGDLARWRMADGKNEKFMVEWTREFFYLLGRTHTILIRKAREKTSKVKFALARRAARILSVVPTIQFIGITGSLAMNNADHQSDIDLLIITKKKTLWITRMLVKLLSLVKGLPVRSAGRGCAKDTICLNMWLDEDNLTIPPDLRNIYTAHEVLQIVSLVDKNNTFKKFLEVNNWALVYWPKAGLGTRKKFLSIAYWPTGLISFLRFIEPFVYHLQLWYMRNRRTRELIEPGRAFFHPFDWGELVMREFERKKELFVQKKDQRAFINI